MPRNSIWIILFVSLVIRLLFIPHPGFKADIAYWKWWGKVAAEEGITATFNHSNYPPVYLYVLQSTSWIYRLFSPLDGNYWDDNNFLYLFLIKLPYIAADIGIGYLIYLILSTKSNSTSGRSLNLALFGSSLFLLNPAVIYNSAVWGQTDSLSAFFILLMYYLLFAKHYSLFALAITVNIFLKVQSLPFVILAFLVLVKKEGLGRAFNLLIPTIVTAFFINLPHILANNFIAPISTMINSLGYFPYASLNAYNLHWLLIGGQSDSYPDHNLIAGFITHKSLGLMLFGLCAVLLILFLWKKLTKEDKTPVPLFYVSLLLIFSSFLFMTEIHERYFFPIYVFGALLVPLSITTRLRTTFSRHFAQSRIGQVLNMFNSWSGTSNETTRGIKASESDKESRWSVSEKNVVESWSATFTLPIYICLALSGLLSLHLVMIQNYPDNNLKALAWMESARIPISLVLSVLNLAIFSILFFPVLRSIPGKIWVGLISVISLIGLIKSITPTPSSISLTSLSPSSFSQGWGDLAYDQSVGGNLLAPAYYYHRTGLGAHANSQITYQLDKKFSKFTTSFGVDIESPDSGSARFAVLVDDTLKFASDVMRKWTPPQYTEIDVTGAEKLTLVVTDADDGINGDHADWLEPMLIK